MILRLRIALFVYATLVASAAALKCKGYFGAGQADVDIKSPTELCKGDTDEATQALILAETTAGQECVRTMSGACAHRAPACYWEIPCEGAQDCYRSQEQQPVQQPNTIFCCPSGIYGVSRVCVFVSF